MAKSKTTNETELVNAYISKLDPSLATVIEAIRKVILSADKEIGEQIKWNSPSFYYTGEMKPFDPKEYKRDIVVVNLHKGYALLVFPTGAKIKEATDILEGNYTDGRRLVKIMDMKDLKAKEVPLKKVLKEWLSMVEK